jgi:hypothetical protein
MEITTRIQATSIPDQAHHPECNRNHTVHLLIFSSESPQRGYGLADCRNCMLYEMEDTTFDSIVAAYETSEFPNFVGGVPDDVDAWQAATQVAADADALSTGGRASRRNTVRAA